MEMREKQRERKQRGVRKDDIYHSLLIDDAMKCLINESDVSDQMKSHLPPLPFLSLSITLSQNKGEERKREGEGEREREMERGRKRG
jgi:hypothetical protein